jgi:hypothetical protein
MNAAEIVEFARAIDIELTAEGSFILARPKGATPRTLAETIRANKPALLSHLRETDRIAQLDDKRRERDRIAKRGYDFDCLAPSHRDYLKRVGQFCSCLKDHPSEFEPPAIARDLRTPLIPDAIRAKIEAIEAEARAKGWQCERLWNAGFWDLPRGLAALLDPEDEIREVTADYIEILKFGRDLQRFRRGGA